MPTAFSTYAILLDFQQDHCGIGNICIHRFGSLAQMRSWKGKTCNGQVAAWPGDQFDRSDIEPIDMLDLAGNTLSGTIAKLSYLPSHADAFATVQP